VQRGGFPEFVLQPINFDALFMQAQAQAQAEAQANAGQAGAENGGAAETH
jgi:preprotein translocase subunit SecB